MEPVRRFVLDTSLFTNPHAYDVFGASPELALHAFLALAARSRSEFYMPRSVFEELFGMIEAPAEVVGEFERVVRIRSPRRHGLMIPANLLYEFIEEVRRRMDRGLRIAEEHARLGSAQESDPGRLIARLRERYREALRRGIIDSREDADVLLLALELEAALVTADEGLRTWADKAGVMLVRQESLKHLLEHEADQS